MSQPYLPPDDPQAYPHPQAQSERTSGWAVASLVLGIGSFCLWLFAGIPAIICGIVGMNKASQPGVGGKGLALTGIITGSASAVVGIPMMGILLAVLLPAVNAAREAARRADSTNRMKQQSLAVLTYELQRQSLPAAYGSAAGPPSSWRTALAPYLEAGQVYDQYDFEQPWDSPTNAPLADSMPGMFQNPNSIDPALTNYLVLVGTETAFPPDGPGRALPAKSQTVLIVEADEDRSVPWTEPRDIDYDAAKPLNGLGNFRPGVFLVAFADGSSRAISSDIDPEVFRAMVTRDSDDNGDIIDFSY